MKNNKQYVVVEIIEPTDSNGQHINVLLRPRRTDGQMPGSVDTRVFHATVGHLAPVGIDDDYFTVEYYFDCDGGLGFLRGVDLSIFMKEHSDMFKI